MRKHLLLASVFLGALSGASFVGVRADETSIPPPTAKADAPQAQREPDMVALMKKSHIPRSQIPGLSGTTSVTLDYPTSSPKDALTLLQSPVAFAVKDASFLGALDAMMVASGKTCHIECRRVLAMKLSFGLKNASVGFVLHTLALAGGCNLYVLPDRLIVAAPDQLSDKEKQTARLYGVVQSAANLAPGSFLGRNAGPEGFQFNLLEIANSKVSFSLDDLSPREAIYLTNSSLVKNNSVEYRVPLGRQSVKGDPTRITLSIQDMKFADALATVAHLSGCGLYVLPDRFLICAPDDLRPKEKSVALRVYTSDSVNFKFDAPSAPSA